MANFTPIVLAVVAALCTSALGVFPVPNTLYYIRNVASGLYFDVAFSSSAPGTPIIGNFINSPQSGNQQWYVLPQPGGLYGFQASFPAVVIHASNIAGSGVTVESTGTFFNITSPPGNPNRYLISYLNGTITSPGTFGSQLTIQAVMSPGSLTSQLWDFVPA